MLYGDMWVEVSLGSQSRNAAFAASAAGVKQNVYKTWYPYQLGLVVLANGVRYRQDVPYRVRRKID